MLWRLTYYFCLLILKLFRLKEKVINPGLKYGPVLMGYKIKIIKTVLDRMFLSISWLKSFIVAYSIITLNVFFNKEQMWPCLSLFFFVWFLIQKWITTLADPLVERERERWGAQPWLGYQLRGCCAKVLQKVGGKTCKLSSASTQSRKKKPDLELSACHCCMFSLTKQEVGFGIFSDWQL